MAAWENDPEIRHLFIPFLDESTVGELTSPEEVAQRAAPGVSSKRRGFQSMILLDGSAVGEINLVVDPAHVFSKIPNTGWAGIVIGEARARGRGIGRVAMLELERRARAMGVERIELGVFEHNVGALRFYEKLGYQRIAEAKEKFWWQGRRWDDLRLLKAL